MLSSDCPQCKGCGQVADVPQFPKPAWTDYENRPKAGPDPMTDFVKPVPCPRCEFAKREEQTIDPDSLETVYRSNLEGDLRQKAVDYRKLADQYDQYASVAAALTPDSDGERAFRELLKSQGVTV